MGRQPIILTDEEKEVRRLLRIASQRVYRENNKKKLKEYMSKYYKDKIRTPLNISLDDVSVSVNN